MRRGIVYDTNWPVLHGSDSAGFIFEIGEVPAGLHETACRWFRLR